MNLFSRNDGKEVFNHMEITLQVIFVYVKPHLKMHYVLSPIQQLLLTLLRLRLNLCGQDLGY